MEKVPTRIMVVAALAMPPDQMLVVGLTMMQIMETLIAVQEEQMLLHGCSIKLGCLWVKCNPLEKGSILPTVCRGLLKDRMCRIQGMLLQLKI
eukprot:308926-Karenia_brevis.AAC.1